MSRVPAVPAVSPVPGRLRSGRRRAVSALLGGLLSLAGTAALAQGAAAPAAPAPVAPAAAPAAAAPVTPSYNKATAKAGADGVPADALVDRATKNVTIFPVVKADGNTLSYASHRRDVSKYLTQSYDDKRATPRPTRVTLEGPLGGDAARGKAIAMNTQNGNCWACHALPGDAQPGTAGPSLLGFKARGYSDAQVYQQIYDARVSNPHTLMPPYGTFGTLSDQDIRDLTAFLQNIQ